MFGILFGDDGQIADLEPVVSCEVLEGAFVVLRDLVRNKSRHDDER